MKDLLRGSFIMAIYAFLTAFLTSLFVEDLDTAGTFIFLFISLNSVHAILIFIEFILKEEIPND